MFWLKQMGFLFVLTAVALVFMGADAGVAADAGAPSVGDVLEQGSAAVGAVKDAISAKTLATIMGAVSAILFAVIGAFRKWGPLALSGNSVRIVTILGGAAAALAANLAIPGVGIWETVLVFLAGPGSMALHETLKLVKSKKEEPPLPDTPSAEG